jgi:electron transport complex protein RnfE
MYARKNNVVDSALDGIGMGLGFLGALLIMAAIREIFGNGTFAGFEIPVLVNFKIPVLTQAPGGFLVYGLVIAVMNKITASKGGVKKKSFSCEGCPSSAACKAGGHAPCGNDDAATTETVKEASENA